MIYSRSFETGFDDYKINDKKFDKITCGLHTSFRIMMAIQLKINVWMTITCEI